MKVGNSSVVIGLSIIGIDCQSLVEVSYSLIESSFAVLSPSSIIKKDTDHLSWRKIPEIEVIAPVKRR